MTNMRGTAVLGTLALAVAGVALAGDDLTSLSYISYLERYATVRTAQAGEVLEGVVNMPVLAGDRLETARGGRLELQLADGSTVWLDEFSTLDVDAVAGSRDEPVGRTALYLAQGTMAVEIPEQGLSEETLRVESPLGATFLDRPGLYRLDLRSDSLHVEAHSGLAELPTGLGSTIVRGGQEAWLDGQNEVEKSPLRASLDDFWSWVQGRRNPVPTGRTAEYVGASAANRAWVLDSYGEWVYVDGFSSWMWRPRVGAGWLPYTSGRWYWTPVGWTWISYEPWGWFPYHYGSWYFDVSFGWVWSWDSIWGPAWVHWLHYPGYVGWCPRGYYDWWYYRHCDHCWDHRGHPPDRWHDVAFDFSGNVRLRDVDPRPWTFVRADSFTSSRIDRVRIEPGSLLRNLPGDSIGTVRSGPLVTPPTARGGVPRSIETVLGNRPGSRGLPDLTTVLRHGETGADLDTDIHVRPVRTTDLTTISSDRPALGGIRSGRGGTGLGTPPEASTPRTRVVPRGVTAPEGNTTNEGSGVRIPVRTQPGPSTTRKPGEQVSTSRTPRGSSPVTTAPPSPQTPRTVIRGTETPPKPTSGESGRPTAPSVKAPTRPEDKTQKAPPPPSRLDRTRSRSLVSESRLRQPVSRGSTSGALLPATRLAQAPRVGGSLSTRQRAEPLRSSTPARSSASAVAGLRARPPAASPRTTEGRSSAPPSQVSHRTAAAPSRGHASTSQPSRNRP